MTKPPEKAAKLTQYRDYGIIRVASKNGKVVPPQGGGRHVGIGSARAAKPDLCDRLWYPWVHKEITAT